MRDSLTRIGSFARKELVDVIRQPRLLVTLILGPFLILALFGLGYQQNTPALRTVFVSSPDTEFTKQLQAQADGSETGTPFDIEGDIDILGTVDTRGEAVRWLRQGRADVAVVIPDEPIETVQNGERAVFTVLHDRLDPFEQATIRLVARSTVDLVNRRVLEEVVAAGQAESEQLETLVPAARDTAAALRTALERGNRPEAREQRRILAGQLESIRAQAGSTEVLIENIRSEFEETEAAEGVSGRFERLSASVRDIDVGGSFDEEITEMSEVEAELDLLADQVAEFRRVPAEILVSPFGAETDVVGSVDLDITAFYAPGVIALLLQHIGITFGGLSLVRERVFGTPEVFRVSPVHAAQILAGKYLGYLTAMALVGTALSLLMVYAFGVPIVGSIGAYVLVLALLSLASLGIGFAISSLVDSDTQAINLSLIVLLLSIFFSGFFLSLERIVDWVQAVSWSLPITHAIDSLRDVMFRNIGIDARTYLALGVGSVGAFVAALALFQRRLRAE